MSSTNTLMIKKKWRREKEIEQRRHDHNEHVIVAEEPGEERNDESHTDNKKRMAGVNA